MTPELALTIIVRPTLSLLPPSMDSPEARAMLIAIGLQESEFMHRRQVGGPARSFWQLELAGGVTGVLLHKGTKDHIRDVLATLAYPPESWVPTQCYSLIEHNDIAACAFARLLLWTLPDALPGPGDHDLGWDQYIRAWRPGKPHPDKWTANFSNAWAAIAGSAGDT